MNECKCDYRTRVVGDGCPVCNPERWEYLLEEEGTDKWEGISYTYKIMHNLKGEHKNG